MAVILVFLGGVVPGPGCPLLRNTVPARGAAQPGGSSSRRDVGIETSPVRPARLRSRSRFRRRESPRRPSPLGRRRSERHRYRVPAAGPDAGGYAGEPTEPVPRLCRREDRPYDHWLQLDQAKADHARAGELQRRLWTEARLPPCRPPTHGRRPITLPAINAMIDVTTARDAAQWMHVPIALFALLIVLALACGFFAGLGMSKNPRPNKLHMVAFAGTLALTAYVIANIEFPRLGFDRPPPVRHVADRGTPAVGLTPVLGPHQRLRPAAASDISTAAQSDCRIAPRCIRRFRLHIASNKCDLLAERTTACWQPSLRWSRQGPPWLRSPSRNRKKTRRRSWPSNR